MDRDGRSSETFGVHQRVDGGARAFRTVDRSRDRLGARDPGAWLPLGVDLFRGVQDAGYCGPPKPCSRFEASWPTSSRVPPLRTAVAAGLGTCDTCGHGNCR
jgi:hypothetical protein